jgi:hypothetical protein
MLISRQRRGYTGETPGTLPSVFLSLSPPLRRRAPRSLFQPPCFILLAPLIGYAPTKYAKEYTEQEKALRAIRSLESLEILLTLVRNAAISPKVRLRGARKGG